MDLRVRFHLVCVMHDSARVVGVNVFVFVGAFSFWEAAWNVIVESYGNVR